jgi:uncharacterized RDD family membrane protein YckC
MDKKEINMDRETIKPATTFGDTQEQSKPSDETNSSVEQPQLKPTNSHLRLQALSTLRNATTPRDVNLDKTRNLPREERLGKPLPPPPPPPEKTSQQLVKIAPWQADPAKVQPHPWHRFFARIIDSVVTAFIIAVPPFFVQIAYAMLNVERGAIIGVAVTTVLSVIAGLIYEPAMLTMFGTTLGKAMFKIKVREQLTGENLSFGRACIRLLWVAWYSGNLLTLIPLVGTIAPIVGHIMQYKKLVNEKITSYDERMKVRYEHG